MADKLINTAPIERVAAIRNGEIRLDCGLLFAPILHWPDISPFRDHRKRRNF
nr:MAG TPA: hypothetical protein [Caudoviricetes sp.]